MLFISFSLLKFRHQLILKFKFSILAIVTWRNTDRFTDNNYRSRNKPRPYFNNKNGYKDIQKMAKKIDEILKDLNYNHLEKLFFLFKLEILKTRR
jgi:hypothetical protein